jgi:hypothetical protein
VADLSAALAPEQWARILRSLENAQIEYTPILDRLHTQFGRLAPEHGCRWPGMQRANGAHAPFTNAEGRSVCTCGMPWPHMDLEWD